MPSLSNNIELSHIILYMLANILRNVVARVGGWFIAGVCIDILSNWSGTKLWLSEMFPSLATFLPHLAFAILMTFLSFQIPFLIRMSEKFNRWRISRRPEEKFHADLEIFYNLRYGIEKMDNHGCDSDDNDVMRRLCNMCSKHRIPSPKVIRIGYHDTYADLWKVFCDRLIFCAERKDLCSARNIFFEMEDEMENHSNILFWVPHDD